MLLSDISGGASLFVFLSTSIVGVGGIFKSPSPPLPPRMAVLFWNLPGREHRITTAFYSSGDVGELQDAWV